MRYRAVAAIFFVLVASGCGVLGKRSPEEAVAKRAQDRVDLLRAGEYDAAYTYATPGYRTTESVSRYGTRWAGVNMWLSADVTSVLCDYDKSGVTRSCKAFLGVTYIAAGHGEQETLLEERWIAVDGRWYLHQRLAE